MIRVLLAAVALRLAAGSIELLEAAGEGDEGLVRQLLADGVDPNFATADGETPLHVTCISGETPSMSALVEAGAHVDARATGKRSLRMTPLTWCVYGGHTESVGLLLRSGADPNLIVDDEQGNFITALDIARRIGDMGVAIEELLVDAGGLPAAELSEGS